MNRGTISDKKKSGYSEEEYYLKLISDVKPEYTVQTLNLMDKFKFIVNPMTKELDTSKILQIANEHPDLAIVSTLNQQFTSNQKMPIKNLVDSSKEFVFSAIGGSYLDKGIKKTCINWIENVIVKLNSQIEHPWISFYTEAKNKTSYRYNILFIFQRASFLVMTPISFEITILANKDTVLDLKLTDKAEYHVSIKLIQVIQSLNPC
ncbi:hypothetical protein [Bacillus toyonensis]|uniref:hypothetical protein n=1 Tax=Bacillus toyonensis TaxID=155322 RepID=UPI002E1D9B1E|nr:hypothetical protein [Bacillus toyonensis]